jgi:predicted MFS family arabinose efflux permease
MLGLVFSAASVGLALGAFFVAPLADRFGRRGLMLAALAAIAVSHALSVITDSIFVLMALRFLMGLGLGVLVVSLNVLVSEYSNNQRRNFLLSILHAGFTIGMMVGGLTAALLLEPFGWRAIFVFGTAMNIALLACLFFFLWESPAYLLAAQPKNALARINEILSKLGHQALAALPPRPERSRETSGLQSLLTKELRTVTLLMWLASLSYAVVGYFLLNWKPTVLVDAGLTPTQASWSGVIEGFLGVGGHIAMGALARNGGEGRMTAVFFGALGVCLVIFGNMGSDPIPLIAMAAAIKFFTVGAYTGVFLAAIALYAPRQRTTALGFVVGWGRVGAIIGPFLGGLVLGAEIGRPGAFGLFAAISIIPVVAMLALNRKAARSADAAAAAA